jgi:superfamily II DNA/RNA helicase
MSFDELGLSDRVLQAVTSAGYTTPTPIQAQAIPHVMQKRDVLGIAQTGTGKTAAFTLPMISLLEQGRARARMPRTLILEPTRELAAQVEENFNKYSVGQKMSVALLIGGMSFGDQDAKITRGVDVLIATPGRMLDHYERGKLLLTGVEILVIDEADRMLDMGFIPDIERIAKLCPFTRQTLFFTATMPPEIQRITEQFLSNPVRIEVSRPATAATTITQRLVASGREDYEKRETLRNLIRDAADLKNAIVFCNRKRDVATLTTSLEKHGFGVACLHGDMDQRARMNALDNFRSGRVPLLVASDVAARGLDIPDVSHVFNYDVPIHADDYIHRIGRTGRAGRSGAAFTIVSRADRKHVEAIEKLTGANFEWAGISLEDIVSEPGAEERPRRPDRGKPSRRAPDRARERPEPSRRAERAKTDDADRGLEATHGPANRAPSPRASMPTPQPLRQHAPLAASAPRAAVARRPQRDDDDRPVKGLGDHVPGFLMRPVRLPKG